MREILNILKKIFFHKIFFKLFMFEYQNSRQIVKIFVMHQIFLNIL